jgi:hypothetical protein
MRSGFSFRHFTAQLLGAGLLASLAGTAGAQQIFFDSFESGAKDHQENGVSWTSGTGVSVVKDFGHTGSNSLKFSFVGGGAGEDAWAEQRFNLGRAYNEVVVEWYAYYPTGGDGKGVEFVHRRESPGNNKFIRLWRGPKSDGNDGYSNFTLKAGASTDSSGTSGDEMIFGEYGSTPGETNQTGVGPNGSDGNGASAGSFNNFLTDSYRGRWMKIKVRVKASTARTAADGIIELYRDDVLMSRASVLKMYPGDGAGGFDFGYLMGWANSGFAQASSMYIDDVRISTSDTPVVRPSPPTGASAN